MRMSRKTPTASEVQVLQILWDRGEATAPEIHDEICHTAKVGYTTVLKRIQRMEDKGLVARTKKQGRAFKYKSVRQPDATRRTLVSKLIKTAFDNSPNALIQHAVSAHDLSADDIEELRVLLDKLEDDLNE